MADFSFRGTELAPVGSLLPNNRAPGRQRAYLTFAAAGGESSEVQEALSVDLESRNLTGGNPSVAPPKIRSMSLSDSDAGLCVRTLSQYRSTKRLVPTWDCHLRKNVGPVGKACPFNPLICQW